MKNIQIKVVSTKPYLYIVNVAKWIGNTPEWFLLSLAAPQLRFSTMIRVIYSLFCETMNVGYECICLLAKTPFCTCFYTFQYRPHKHRNDLTHRETFFEAFIYIHIYSDLRTHKQKVSFSNTANKPTISHSCYRADILIVVLRRLHKYYKSSFFTLNSV